MARSRILLYDCMTVCTTYQLYMHACTLHSTLALIVSDGHALVHQLYAASVFRRQLDHEEAIESKEIIICVTLQVITQFMCFLLNLLLHVYTPLFRLL